MELQEIVGLAAQELLNQIKKRVELHLKGKIVSISRGRTCMWRAISAKHSDFDS